MKRKELVAYNCLLAMEKNYLLGKGKKQKKINCSSNTVSNQINSINGEELFIPWRCTQQNDTAEEMNIDDTAKDIHFPEEIVMNILSRLPVRSLQRFKCVSPFWSALISDHYFTMKHLNRAKNDLNSQRLLTANYHVGFNSFSLSSPVQVIENEQRLDGPPNYYSIQSILLPSQEYALRCWVFGLGYDATGDDYKILAADLNVGSFGNVSVRILPLKSGSWRKIDKYPTGMRLSSGYSDCVRSSLTFIHGAFHWLIYKSPCYTIMSFNISNEVYREIPLLDWMYRMWMFKIDHGVQVLRGMLYYYSTHNIEGCPSTFKLWTMKDYGVKESWIQWLTIREMGVGSAIPHCVFADGEVLLRLRKFPPITSLYWTSIRGSFDLFPEFRRTFVYKESLISPKLLI
ncbi:hypothetical protein P3S68_010135 [Capsicum galapagoense]